MSADLTHEDAGGTPPKQASEPPRSPRSRLPLYLAGSAFVLLVLLAAAVFIWKTVAVRRLEARLASERSASSSAQKEALAMQARDLLRLTARPLAWAVRAEMLRGNLGQVDDYFREFVRERGVMALLLVGKDGRIALATDRKLETQAADSVVSGALLAAADVSVEESGTSLRLSVPIMGFDSRLGTLVIDFDTHGR